MCVSMCVCVCVCVCVCRIALHMTAAESVVDCTDVGGAVYTTIGLLWETVGEFYTTLSFIVKSRNSSGRDSPPLN